MSGSEIAPNKVYGVSIDSSVKKIALFIFMVTLSAYVFLFEMRYGSSNWPSPYKISCDARQEAKLPLLKCDDSKEHNDRRRLSFGRVIEADPELAERIGLLRDRIHDLESSNRRSAAWAHDMSMWASFFVTAVLLTALFFLPEAPSEAGASTVAKAAAVLSKPPVLVGLVALVAAASQSLAYHSKYAAFHEAQRRYVGVSIDLDAALVNTIKNVADSSKRINVIEKFEKRMDAWIKELKVIEGEFGKSYGKTYTLISIPNLFGK